MPNWSNNGMIILDYLDITTKVSKLQENNYSETNLFNVYLQLESLKTIHVRDIETRWEGLKPQLAELCSRINAFPCPSAKHRLCQSEIAQGLAVLVDGIALNNEINPCLLVKNAIEKLPLPEEFAKQKINALLDDQNLIEMLLCDEN